MKRAPLGSASAATRKAQIEAAERDLGAKLPREYRDRLAARNGGDLSTAGEDWRIFPLLDSGDARTAAKHIVLETRNARALEGFPKDAVAIASNGKGDFLVLVPEGSPGGLDPQLQLWNHETRKCKPVALRYE